MAGFEDACFPQAVVIWSAFRSILKSTVQQVVEPKECVESDCGAQSVAPEAFPGRFLFGVG